MLNHWILRRASIQAITFPSAHVASALAAALVLALITNGYLLTPARIKLLNRAGLDHLQISIDNVHPDEISKKSLKVLDKKLRWFAA